MLRIKSLSWVVSMLLLAFSSGAATAGPITSLYYLAGGELRSVGFDGTSFTGAFSTLEVPVPEMSGISYDSTSDILYYLAGGELRSVGFDGTSFTGAFSTLEVPVPEMSGISYDSTSDILYYLAGGELRSVGFDGMSFTGAFSTLEVPVPEMFGISVFRIADQINVPEPAALALFAFGLASLGVAARQRGRTICLTRL
ncbi:MAG: PEP-CTERM sorting domain-containing protein [Oricola sp.]